MKPRKCFGVELPLSDYREIHQLQLDMVTARHTGALNCDTIFILEHHPVYTIGRNGSRDHLIGDITNVSPKDIPVIRIERGGEITYHGPGQVVGYPVIDLKAAGMSVKGYMRTLEEVMIRTAEDFSIQAERKTINPGIWVAKRKLGSVGVAVRRGIAFHGFALNVNPDLTPFSRINPCGLEGVQMTSLEKEKNKRIAMTDVRQRIWHHLVKQLHCQMDFVDLSALPIGKPASPTVRRATRKIDTPIKVNRKSRTILKNPSGSMEQATNGPSGQGNNPLSGKPKWLRRSLPSGPSHEKVRNLIHTKGLHTVCQQAKCPNQFECFSQQTATFLILGDRCTRDCRFCNVLPGPGQPPDPDEPRKVSEAVKKMKLKYVIITSVTRDDLPDGGAAHFAETIQWVRKAIRDAQVEVLIPDFQGNEKPLNTVLSAGPNVLNHNVETVPRLYPMVRPQADYERSLILLKRVSSHRQAIPAKSGIMLGLGETDPEIKECLRDILNTGCRMLTLGQYLQPTRNHLPVARYVPPEVFDTWRERALEMGFGYVASGPFVRSSYHAKDLYRESRIF